MIKNSFGKILEQLLSVGNIKNSTVAKALKYDVSYISKWVTGKAVPSKKNLERILYTIGDVIIAQIDADVAQKMYNGFDVKNEEDLRDAIVDTLREAYFETTGEVNTKLYLNNAALYVKPKELQPFFINLVENIDPNEDVEIAVMADIFSMNHAGKLYIAGIDQGHFRVNKKRKNVTLNYVISLTSLDGNSIYDMALFIHMMNCFSKLNFQVYASPLADKQLMISVKDSFAGVTMMGKDKQYLCTVATGEKKAVNGIYETISAYMDPDKLIFSSENMETMLTSQSYLKNLFSTNLRWLVGHITEHFLPDDVFLKICSTHFVEDDTVREEIERAHLMASKVLEKGQARVLLYDSALIDFMLNGELDFFNQKIMLSKEDRIKVLRHMKHILQHSEPRTIRVIQSKLRYDFKNLSNLCIFLSSSMGYLRLANGLCEDNLLLIKDDSVHDKFDQFFEKIWDELQDVVIFDHEEILQKMDKLIETSEVLL